MSFIRRFHNMRPLDIPRRDTHGLVNQQFQDFIRLGAAGRVSSTLKDLKLLICKPIRQGDCLTCRFRVSVAPANTVAPRVVNQSLTAAV